MKSTKKREVFVGYERSGSTELQVITDAETGEVLSQQWVTKSTSKPGRPSKGESQGAHFIRLYRTNANQTAKEREMSLPEAGLYYFLITFAGWQTPYIVNPDTGENMNCSEIADYLKIDRKHVQDLLDRLVEKGLISKIIRGKGLPNHFLINTNIAFYGKTIDDLSHIDVFKNCGFEPKVYINYKKTPEKTK